MLQLYSLQPLLGTVLLLVLVVGVLLLWVLLRLHASSTRHTCSCRPI